jgi:hypothetical protein
VSGARGLDGVFRPVWPYLGDPLIPPACIAEIAAVARQLPAGMSAFAGFECRLGAAEARADFSVCTMAVGAVEALEMFADGRGGAGRAPGGEIRMRELPTLGVGDSYRAVRGRDVLLQRERLDCLEVIADHYVDRTPRAKSVGLRFRAFGLSRTPDLTRPPRHHATGLWK